MSVAERAAPEQKITMEVFRYLPDQEEEPRFQSYEIPFRQDSQAMLSA